ncbi:FAD-linked oxidase C-terminal domain-containing protein [Hoeflea sp. AS60]|uniref:FAD-linked oxidase C-terminal domain-containing protein n=1 Tax=Hoeflea sp. AS60 TaxID=3135780 RepID=UPI003182B1BA
MAFGEVYTALSCGASVQSSEAIGDIVYTTVREFGGTISAEHGIGLLKRPYLHYSRNPQELALMRRLKPALDPGKLLNPVKVLDLMEGDTK